MQRPVTPPQGFWNGTSALSGSQIGKKLFKVGWNRIIPRGAVGGAVLLFFASRRGSIAAEKNSKRLPHRREQELQSRLLAGRMNA